MLLQLNEQRSSAGTHQIAGTSLWYAYHQQWHRKVLLVHKVVIYFRLKFLSLMVGIKGTKPRDKLKSAVNKILRAKLYGMQPPLAYVVRFSATGVPNTTAKLMLGSGAITQSTETTTHVNPDFICQINVTAS